MPISRINHVYSGVSKPHPDQVNSRFLLENCPQRKVVSRMGVGVDSIDIDAATELGVLVCNVPGINTADRPTPRSSRSLP